MEYQINNELRAFLGLMPLSPAFTTVKMDTLTLYYEGDRIKKLINHNSGDSLYSETDTDIATENREWILPSSKRGKKHPLDTLRLSNINHKGISLNIRLKPEIEKPYIDIENRHNNLQMTIPLPGHIKTLDGFLAYAPELMRQAPPYWQDMIRSIRDTPKRAIRYQHGDIVRIALDWKKFAFALIIGKFSDYRKWGILPQDHPYTHIMTVPVILRFYDFIWDNPIPTLDMLAKTPLQDPIIVMDDTILRNTHPIIFHKELTEDDILFPQHCSILYKSSNPDDNSIGYHVKDNEHLKHLISLGYKLQLSLAWGFGMTTIHTEELEQRLPPLEEYHRASNTGVGLLHIIDKENKPYFPYPDFARHPKQKEVFAYFGVANEDDL